MRTALFSLALVAASSVLPSCSCVARDAERYRADTRSLVETKNAAIKKCYDVALVTNPELSGDVIVNFKLEKKTGKIIETSVDKRSTAPESLGQCIVEAVDGLTLDPVDRREGQATMTWTFKANPPKPAA